MYVGVNTHVHISKKIIYTLSIHEYIESSSLHSVYTMGWLRLVGSLQLQVSFANETYKRDDILQQRPTILRSLLIVATPEPWLAATCACVVVCYGVLQCVAVYCAVLQCAAVAERALMHTRVPRRMCVLQCVAVCCSVHTRVPRRMCVLQCVAVGCSVLQCVAVCCSVLQCVAVRFYHRSWRIDVVIAFGTLSFLLT